MRILNLALLGLIAVVGLSAIPDSAEARCGGASAGRGGGFFSRHRTARTQYDSASSTCSTCSASSSSQTFYASAPACSSCASTGYYAAPALVCASCQQAAQYPGVHFVHATYQPAACPGYGTNCAGNCANCPNCVQCSGVQYAYPGQTVSPVMYPNRAACEAAQKKQAISRPLPASPAPLPPIQHQVEQQGQPVRQMMCMNGFYYPIP